MFESAGDQFAVLCKSVSEPRAFQFARAAQMPSTVRACTTNLNQTVGSRNAMTTLPHPTMEAALCPGQLQCGVCQKREWQSRTSMDEKSAQVSWPSHPPAKGMGERALLLLGLLGPLTATDEVRHADAQHAPPAIQVKVTPLRPVSGSQPVWCPRW